MQRYTLNARYGQPCFWGEECFLKTILQQARSALTRSKDTAAEKEASSPDSAKQQSAVAAATSSAGSAQQATARLNALLGATDSAALQAQTPEQTQATPVELSPQTTAEFAASSKLSESAAQNVRATADNTEQATVSVCADATIPEGKTATESAAEPQEITAAVAAADTAPDTSETVTTTTSPQFYPVVVSTPAELAAAHKAGAKKILVKGELASKLETAFGGLRSLSSASLNALALVLSGAALLAPFTGGVSLGAAGTVMGTLGAALTATAIAAISAIGLSLVVAVFKGYDEIKLAGGGVELRLKKHVPKAEKQAAETDSATAATVADAEVKAAAKADVKAEDKAHEPKTSAAAKP